MDIDIRNLKYALKGSIKRERCIKYSLCFKCENNSYFLTTTLPLCPNMIYKWLILIAIHSINFLVTVFDFYLIPVPLPVSTTYKDKAITNIL